MRWVWLLLAVACVDGNPPARSSGSTVFLTPTAHLVRASMALRGIRPSLDELRAVNADPSALPAIVDRYLDSSEFGETVRELHNEVLLLRIQRPDYVPDVPGVSRVDVEESLLAEPLHLIEDVVMTNQPYTKIVTADYTMADSTVALVWGTSHSDSPGWERATWPDGRPAAGILASPAIPMRYRSAANNANRGRANAISRSLLCHDFLTGDVQIDPKVDLSNSAIVANALIANPSCAGCHQALDPLASYFWPYLQGNTGISGAAIFPVDWYYDPSHANDWFVTTYRPPGYFGQDVQGLDGLGHAIADDPRFARCAAVHFASYLTEVGGADLPAPWIAELQHAFTADHFNAKHLARAIVLSDQFRVAYSSDPTAADGVVGYQKVRPAQLQRMLADITGFVWQVPYSNQTYLDDDLTGFRVLGGGIDSFFVTRPVHTMTATSNLVVQRAAYLAAEFLVAHDVDPTTVHTYLHDVHATDEPTIRAELDVLQQRIFGDLSGDTDATFALFTAALAATRDDPQRAWIVTLTGMLSDVKAVYY